ncbi:MAG: NAD(P)-dependent glycerol-3-phosphate dehydrogenase [Rhodoferax sp.]|jgi:glycerol-3-phosphate dehydrogenase (NAD(P)+)|nr:NAD(P)-dependent glycerol-3-phosphate dehydrogenase [Rhodoferax sp.]
MSIAIVGAGAWGTALAVSAAARAQAPHAVSLWARDAAQLDAMREQRVNQRYLPDVPFPPSLELRQWPGAQPGGDSLQTLASASLVVLAGPMAALRDMLTQLRDCPVPVVWLCKGFERMPGGDDARALGLMAHEVQAQVAPDLRAGVLSGPSFAQEVAVGQPAALVAASVHEDVRAAMVGAFHGPTLRIYASDDIVGVEVGGAVKNVLAIATGLCDGLQLGLNARAALITRGLHEMTRLGVALGANPETFMGLSGLGDLVLTATGDLSRNRRVGLALASGQTLAQAVQSLGHVAEGVYCARTVVRRAASLGIEMPIAEAVDALLDGRLDPAQAVSELMSREARDEV